MLGKIVTCIVVLFVAVILLGKCVAEDEPDYSDISRPIEGFDSPSLPETDEGFAISAPSDPGARYRILEIESLPNGNLEVVSRRDGPSGTSFARREIDCVAYAFRYLGEGDTRDEAMLDRSSQNMGPLTGSSASSDVANAACARGAQ